MKHALNTARIGLFVLLGLGLLWIIYESLERGTFFRQESYTLLAEFSTVKTLKPGDDVRMAGVKIGRVADTRLREGTAVAVLEIAESFNGETVRIPDDSVASVAMSGIIGGNYLDIEYGSSTTYLADGDTIRTRHTADLNEMFAQIGELGERIEGVFGDLGGAFSSITGTGDEPGVLQNLNELIRENRESLRETMANIQSITEKIDRGEGTLARLINDETAYNSLLSAVEEIGNAARDASELTTGANEIIAQIQSGEGTVGGLIYRDDLINEIQAIAANLRGVSDKIARGEGTLGRLLSDEELYQDIREIVRKAERTLDGLSEQGPITAVGIAAGALF